MPRCPDPSDTEFLLDWQLANFDPAEQVALLKARIDLAEREILIHQEKIDGWKKVKKRLETTLKIISHK